MQSRTALVGAGGYPSDCQEKTLDMPCGRCTSIAFDPRFCVLVEAAGDEGLRIRQCTIEASKICAQGEVSVMQLVTDVVGYLNVPTSHIAFTPYNMMLCCHRNGLSMVRHCTGRLVHQMTLDCAEINAVAFDSSTDSFFVSDPLNKAILCMQYMEFHKIRKIDTKFAVSPAGLCVFASTLIIPNSSTTDDFCGICYKLDNRSVFKIQRAKLPTQATKESKKANEAVQNRPLRPTSLNGVVVLLPQAGSQQSKASMIGISDTDRAIYTYRVRLHKVKEGTASHAIAASFRFKSREDSFFADRAGNVRVPRSLAAISNEFVAVYYEVNSPDGQIGTCGILVLQAKPSSQAELAAAKSNRS